MKKRNKGKWHFGWHGRWSGEARSVCGIGDYSSLHVIERKRPRLKDRCERCAYIAKGDLFFGMDDYFWFRRREE